MAVETVASADGTPIAFERWGAGPTLLLVHGAAASRTRWRRVVPRLAETFQVVAMDRRGRGDSGDTAPHDLEREVEDVLAVIAALPGPLVLFGHSLGAIVSLEAALRTGALAALILYEPPMFEGDALSDDALARLDAAMAAGDRESVVTIFLKEAVHMPDAEFARFRAGPAWANRVAAAHILPRELKAVQAYRIDRARFARLAVPALQLTGGDSPPPVRAVGDMLDATLPDIRTVVMPGQQHIAMDTAPDMVVDAVLDFWREIAGA